MYLTRVWNLAIFEFQKRRNCTFKIKLNFRTGGTSFFSNLRLCSSRRYLIVSHNGDWIANNRLVKPPKYYRNVNASFPVILTENSSIKILALAQQKKSCFHHPWVKFNPSNFNQNAYWVRPLFIVARALISVNLTPLVPLFTFKSNQSSSYLY